MILLGKTLWQHYCQRTLLLKQEDRIWDVKEIVRYSLVGMLTTVIGLLVYYGLVFSILSPWNPIQLQLANIISWLAGVTFAYTANRKAVFKSHSTNIIREMRDFYLARVGTLLIEMAEMYIMVTLLGMNDKSVKIIVMFITVVLNYLFGKLWVFRDCSKTANNKTKGYKN